MDELKTKIDLKPLTDKDIQENLFELSELWMLQKGEDQVAGPFDTATLRSYSHTYEFLFEEDVKVHNLQDQNWKDFFSFAQFQRRKPQLVSAHNLGNEQEFYFLVHGQKQGPYQEDHMQDLLDSGDITPSTQISLDIGKSWIKLYEFHAFDRRSKKSNQELPFRPEQNILEQINAKKDELHGDGPDDALVELAFMGGHKNDQVLELELASPKSKSTPKRPKVSPVAKQSLKAANRPDSSKLKYIIGSAVSVLVILVFASFKSGQFSPDVGGEVKTVSKGINNSARAALKREPANIAPKKKVAPRRMVKKRLAPARFKAPPRRTIRNKPLSRKDGFERNIENIDVNDPDVQEELTRQLAGDYEEEEDLEGDRNEEDDNERDFDREDDRNDEEVQLNEDERIDHQYR
jgi:hypothetical protein